jgi:hypothetical protein
MEKENKLKSKTNKNNHKNTNFVYVTPEKKTIPTNYSPGKKPIKKFTD